eukprot:4548297-Lingulodinium_polyedra.AAC.1
MASADSGARKAPPLKRQRSSVEPEYYDDMESGEEDAGGLSEEEMTAKGGKRTIKTPKLVARIMQVAPKPKPKPKQNTSRCQICKTSRSEKPWFSYFAGKPEGNFCK